MIRRGEVAIAIYDPIVIYKELLLVPAVSLYGLRLLLRLEFSYLPYNGGIKTT